MDCVEHKVIIAEDHARKGASGHTVKNKFDHDALDDTPSFDKVEMMTETYSKYLKILKRN